MSPKSSNSHVTRGWSLQSKLAFRSRRSSDGCLLWKSRQYRLFWDGRLQSVRRFAFALSHGPVRLDEKIVCRCWHTRCIEPLHLFAGSQAVLSARFKRRRGERNGNHKLTRKQVLTIRAAAGPQRMIADLFGVSRTTVGLIRRRRAWTHLHEVAQTIDAMGAGAPRGNGLGEGVPLDWVLIEALLASPPCPCPPPWDLLRVTVRFKIFGDAFAASSSSRAPFAARRPYRSAG
jgi:hypothetical protein